MKQTELITGVGGDQEIYREPGVKIVRRTGQRGCGMDRCAWLARRTPLARPGAWETTPVSE
jgi:hypothetical protein